MKKELESITNEEINNTLLIVNKNKPSNDKSSLFFNDNVNKADSQPHIPTIMTTPIIEKAHLTKFHHLLLKMKLTLSLPAILKILIMITQRHQTFLTVHTKMLNTKN